MRALSLEYHDIVDGDPDGSGFPGPGPASYKLTRADFERHLSAIARAIRRPPRRATEWLAGAVRERPLFLTFDDGGAGACRYTADALERHGWRGHFFVAARWIESRTFLTAADIRELHARGHVIGTHSYSHPTRMGACPHEQILDEWRRSSAVLADLLGEAVVTGSVPGGYYTRRVGEAAAEAGLKLLFTSMPTTRCWSAGGCQVLGRYAIRRWTTPAAATRLAAGRLAPRASQWLWYGGLHLLRMTAGDHYTNLRQRFWAAHRSRQRLLS